MSIKPTKVFQNSGVVVWHTPDEDGAPELPILVHVDAGGAIVLSQEDRDLVISPQTVKDLCDTLKKISKACSKTYRFRSCKPLIP